jgi:hypothetical protein
MSEPIMSFAFQAVSEHAPVRVRIEPRRTPDGVKYWSECDGDQSLDAICGSSALETLQRVLDRINAPLGAKA